MERAAPKGFVGRDASPVLDRYPPKDPSLVLRAPSAAPTNPRSPSAAPVPPTDPSAADPGASGPVPTAPPSPAPTPLITLDRPFDVDEFAAMLGETSIRVTVPRDSLPEVLHRVTEFMGFGIYVYSISVRPAPSELLKSYVVELRRVDYSAEKDAWVPFVERDAGNPS